METGETGELHIGSILLADCGAAVTKAVLLDQVRGQYRFIARGQAPTTAEPPWSSIAVGIRHAVGQIAEITGRRFFDADGDLISPETVERDGVDVFVLTVSASRPLEIVVAGLVRDLSVASGVRVAAGTYSLVKAVLASDGTGGASDGERVRTMFDADPDVICIVGGTEGGAATPVLELVQTAALACSLVEEELRPHLLYAGNSRLRKHVVKIVEGRAKLHVADNVRPTATEEHLPPAQAELDDIFRQEKMDRLPGLDLVTNWSPVPPISTAHAYGRLVQYLWHLGDPARGVLGVDVGAGSTTVVAVFDEQVFLTINSGLGTSFGGGQLLKEQGAQTVTRWIPEPMNEAEAYGLLLNKEMHPTSVPQVPREMWLEQALAREAIRTTLEMGRPGWQPGDAQSYPYLMPFCDTIVISGGVLAHAPHPGQAALIVLDALQPIGISTFVLDTQGLAPVLGGLAAVKPLATVEALDNGGLVNLATVVTPVGHARRGDVILRVQVTYEDQSSFDVEVRYGDLEVLPLPPGREAVVELEPTKNQGFDVGLGGPGEGGKRQVSGGLIGLVIDARGRPLRLLSDSKRRQAQIQQWLWGIGG